MTKRISSDRQRKGTSEVVCTLGTPPLGLSPRYLAFSWRRACFAWSIALTRLFEPSPPSLPLVALLGFLRGFPSDVRYAVNVSSDFRAQE